MAYFIIIRGPLGVGKSTIARMLAKVLDAEYIDIDKIMTENNLDIVDSDLDCIPTENFIEVNKILLPQVKEKLNLGKIVIFDACFYHKEPIEDIIQKLSSPNYAFTLKAPVEICIERDCKRSKTHGEDAARVVHKFVSRFDYGIVIDTNNKTSDKVVQEILSHLPG